MALLRGLLSHKGGPCTAHPTFAVSQKVMAYLCCLIIDNLLGCQVTLVSNKQLVDILIGISVNLIEPLLDIVEAVLICHIINHLRLCQVSFMWHEWLHHAQLLMPLCVQACNS